MNDTVSIHTFGDPSSFAVYLELDFDLQYFVPWCRVGYWLNGVLLGMRTDWYRLDDVVSWSLDELRSFHGKRVVREFFGANPQTVFRHWFAVWHGEAGGLNNAWPINIRHLCIHGTIVPLNIMMYDDGSGRGRIMYTDLDYEEIINSDEAKIDKVCDDMTKFEQVLIDFVDFIEEAIRNWQDRKQQGMH